MGIWNVIHHVSGESLSGIAVRDDGDLAPLSHTCWWMKVLDSPIALTTMHSGWMSVTSSGCRSYLPESFFISHLGCNIM